MLNLPFSQIPLRLLHLGFLLLCLGVMLLFAGCQENKSRRTLIEEAPLISQSLTDDTGRKISLPHAAHRVASIAPNITEMIFAMGAQDRLIARSQACDFPEGVADKYVITTFPAIELEELKQVGPDLIITTDEIFSEQDISQIERLDIPVYLQHYETLADVYRCIEDLGTILDQEREARHLADSLRRLEGRIVAATEDLAKYRTAIIIHADPLKVVGGRGFLHELIEKAGGMNVFEDKTQAYPVTTLEELLYLQPEFIIFPSKDQRLFQELLGRYPLLQNTPAYDKDQFYLVDPDFLYRPGPRMLQGLLELTHILHTQLNPQALTNEQT